METMPVEALMEGEQRARDVHPHQEARVAMVLYNEEYAESGYGSMGFWDQLGEGRKDTCRRIAGLIRESPPESATPDPDKE